MAEPAPLVGTASAPIPEGGVAEWFAGADGLRLRAALFAPTGPSRGSVVVSPGRTEAIEKYVEVAGRLTAAGFVVLVHDWRGQGLSDRMLPDRLLGHARGHAPFLADFKALLNAFEARLPKPWIALGHSMGGCLTLLALVGGEARFSGAVLTAPMLGIRTGATPRPLARLLAAVLTGLGRGGGGLPWPASLATPFETNILTHDRARYARNEGLVAACPDLALGAPTWGWLRFAFTATRLLAQGREVSRLTLPITVVAAGDEVIVDNSASEAVARRLPNGRYVEIPGAFHEILQETDEVQAVFWREFAALADDLAPREGPRPPGVG